MVSFPARPPGPRGAAPARRGPRALRTRPASRHISAGTSSAWHSPTRGPRSASARGSRAVTANGSRPALRAAAWPPRRGHRTPAPRAASCSRAGWRRGRRCTRPRRRRTAWHRRSPVEIRLHATAHVVRGRADRQRDRSRDRARPRGTPRRCRETARAPRRRPDAPATDRPAPGAHRFAHHRGRDDVARRQLAARVVAAHEALAGGVQQPRTLAAQRLDTAESAAARARSARSGGTARTRGRRRARPRATPSPCRRRWQSPDSSSRGTPVRRHRSRAAPRGARRSPRCHRLSRTARRTHRRRSTMQARARALRASANPMAPATRAQSARAISRPVASCACSTRRTLCAPSRPRAGAAVGIPIERDAPLDQLAHVPRALVDEHLDRLASHSPAPAAIVSARCSAGESSGPSAAAMPPCA